MSRHEAITNPRAPITATAPSVQLIAVGDALRRLEIWTEARWESTPPGRRPSPAARCPGLGWVVAGPARPAT